MIANPEQAYEYRSDGWPLCPECGGDSLVSTQYPAFTSAESSFRQSPTDRMKCIDCNWTGTVPGLVPK